MVEVHMRLRIRDKRRRDGEDDGQHDCVLWRVRGLRCCDRAKKRLCSTAELVHEMVDVFLSSTSVEKRFALETRRKSVVKRKPLCRQPPTRMVRCTRG